MSDKETGNAHFKAGEFDAAIAAYKRALDALAGARTEDAAVLHNNMAACYLKLNKPKLAIKHCTDALSITPGLVKALFRRSQAYEQEKDIENAFQDMAKASNLEPKNDEVKKHATRLMGMVVARRDHKMSTKGLSQDMLEQAISGATREARVECIENCVVLAREEPGAEQLFRQGAIERLQGIVEGSDSTMAKAALHVYAGLAARNPKRATLVLTKLTSKELKPTMTKLFQSRDDKVSASAFKILRDMVETFSSAGAEFTAQLDNVLDILISYIPSPSITAGARDSAIGAMMAHGKVKLVAERFLARNGIPALLLTAASAVSPLAETAKFTVVSEVETTKDTRTQISVVLQKLLQATVHQGKNNEELVSACVRQVHFVDDALSNISAVNMLTTIMLASVDIGNQILEMPDVFAHLMTMAQSTNLEAQCAAAEALSYAASDKKRARGVMLEGFPILKQLYGKDLPDSIRVRALVGLCKMGAVNSGSTGVKAFSEGSLINLAKKLRPFLVGDGATADTRKWAAEGIAYLSLDSDVKEYIVNDQSILDAVQKVCVDGDKTVQFALANMLVNITNSYDKPEKTEEAEQLKKLGKFAGEQVPEDDPKDSDEFVQKRVKHLVDSKYVYGLCELAKSDSDNTKEQVSRVLFAMVNEVQHRGTVIAQGGSKALITLAHEGHNTDAGILKAAQALAKLAITADPKIAFPGQRAAELVKPLKHLAKQRNGLMQFEACMALCNLAGSSEELRMKLYREKAVSVLEDLMFDEDPLVRRAATEALCNCFYCEKIFDMFAKKDGESFARLKLWVLFSGTDHEDADIPTARAASGGLALLSSSPDVCWRITEEKQGKQILKELLVSNMPDLQHRGLHIILNMVMTDKKIAEWFNEPEMLMIFSAIFHTSTNETVKNLATQVLEGMVEQKVIASVDDAHRMAAEKAFELSSVKKEPKITTVDEEEEEEEEEEEGEDGDQKKKGEEEEEDIEEIVLEKAALFESSKC